MSGTGCGWLGISDKTCGRTAVVVTYRPVGGEFRTLDLALPEEKAEALFEFLTNRQARHVPTGRAATLAGRNLVPPYRQMGHTAGTGDADSLVAAPIHADTVAPGPRVPPGTA
jgi:hypothetical protein